MAAANKSKAEKEREKVQQDRCQAILSGMLRDEDNKYCVDCDAKGPRWASWNIGVFLCIRCAGIHRNLGVHISKVKSVNLDSWTPQQVASMQNMGNSKGRAVYEANLPDDFRRPTSDSAMEAFIRNKYEKKKFIAKEWVATKPPDLPLGWGQLIEQEKANKAKDGKMVAAVQPAAVSSVKKAVEATASPAVSTAAAAAATPATTTDLLGLAVGHQQPSLVDDDLLGFSAFVCASPSVSNNAELLNQNLPAENNNLSEADFFNQISSGGTTATSSAATTNGLTAADPGKMSKDSILALFGSRPASSSVLGAAVSSPGLFGGTSSSAFPPPSIPGIGPLINNSTSTSNQAALLGLASGFNSSFSPLQQQQEQLFPVRPLLAGGQQQQQGPAAQFFPAGGGLNHHKQPPVNPLLVANNPFLDTAAAVQQPKIINSLPQNVFQMNSQLSGLSLSPNPGGQGLTPSSSSLWQ